MTTARLASGTNKPIPYPTTGHGVRVQFDPDGLFFLPALQSQVHSTSGDDVFPSPLVAELLDLNTRGVFNDRCYHGARTKERGSWLPPANLDTGCSYGRDLNMRPLRQADFVQQLHQAKKSPLSLLMQPGELEHGIDRLTETGLFVSGGGHKRLEHDLNLLGQLLDRAVLPVC